MYDANVVTYTLKNNHLIGSMLQNSIEKNRQKLSAIVDQVTFYQEEVLQCSAFDFVNRLCKSILAVQSQYLTLVRREIVKNFTSDYASITYMQTL